MRQQHVHKQNKQKFSTSININYSKHLFFRDFYYQIIVTLLCTLHHFECYFWNSSLSRVEKYKNCRFHVLTVNCTWNKLHKLWVLRRTVLHPKHRHSYLSIALARCHPVALQQVSGWFDPSWWILALSHPPLWISTLLQWASWKININMSWSVC